MRATATTRSRAPSPAPSSSIASTNDRTGAHFYTTQDDERGVVGARLTDFVDEGVVYAVYPASSQQ